MSKANKRRRYRRRKHIDRAIERYANTLMYVKREIGVIHDGLSVLMAAHIVRNPRCQARYHFSLTEDWICQLDAGHEGSHQWPDPADTLT